MKPKVDTKKRKRFPLFSWLKTVSLALSLILLFGCSPVKENETDENETITSNKGEEILMKDFGEIKAGDTILFGSYDRDGKAGAEKEELSWLVLTVENGKALVITSEGVDSQQYNEKALATDWESCSLREWLNKKFFSEVFTAEEANQIATTEVLWEENPSFPAPAGKAAQDKLFLLSISEAEKYFSSDEARLVKPTPLAEMHSVYADEETGTCAWWLRNQGSVPECAALVTEFGVIDHSGDGVYCEGTAVRPAMWILLP